MIPWRETNPNHEIARSIVDIDDPPNDPLPYCTPTLESIGYWSNLTLQQSVSVGFFSNL